ncbi:hypothetical protein [Marinobacter sp. X15-166B]|uniref:hypothetical protein n=1 Tax=Marinobacter sp. X15-166B TaxID=1897620 RepID=UPI00085C397E|nr:hypothetical protein [Marinobacter sp. X15-166B]OEY67460.1 hypothetical protein BG841_14140 [Marinobacter sp. X15-166B]
MALSKSALKGRIVSEMTALGAEPAGKHSWVERMAEAIANAVVDEIQANATTNVSGGSSAGTWPVT